jgi:hypothetical protein
LAVRTQKKQSFILLAKEAEFRYLAVRTGAELLYFGSPHTQNQSSILFAEGG